MSDEYDSPWKMALERYFPEFMEFFFPEVYTDIDWSLGYEFLDKGKHSGDDGLGSDPAWGLSPSRATP